MIDCPFKVGDRIHELHNVHYHAAGTIDAPPVVDELDPSRPDATVTAVTERGFDYDYDERVTFGRAEYGTWTTGGTIFPAGYRWWRKIG